jgi:hypothetical protein
MVRTLLFALVPWLAFAETARDEGAYSSMRPKIPEPMVFDLIRPLGAAKGEFEVNSLFRQPLAGPSRKLLWAPEIEYAFLEGYGIEFELPLEGAAVDSYKVALQGTLPGPAPARFIHGWQGVGEVARHEHRWQADAMYLAGYRWNRQWSAFSMTGLRREHMVHSRNAFIGNYSAFRTQSKLVTMGLESNLKGRGVTGRGVLLMPQTHLRWERVSLQFGLGWNRAAGRSAPVVSWRISREL